MASSITLTAPEVGAILAGATQVRVPIKPQPWRCPVSGDWWWQYPNKNRGGRSVPIESLHPYGNADLMPYRVGSVLAVREPFAHRLSPAGHVDWSRPMLYKADDPEASDWWIGGSQMRANLARLHLRVLEVSPELHEGRWYWALRVERTEVGRG